VHRPVPPRPVAHGEVDAQRVDADRLVARARDPGKAPQLRPRVAAAGLDALDDLVDAQPLPRVEHLLEQCAPVAKVPVEAALGHAQGPSQRLDADGVGTARGEGAQALLDPARAGCAGLWHFAFSIGARAGFDSRPRRR
jgi:hypothetical protein